MIPLLRLPTFKIRREKEPFLFWRFFSGWVFLLSLPLSARASDTGQFQLLIAAPDPVVAGDRVQFQVIAVNQGTEIWNAKKYYLQAEVYDPDRGYLAQTERFRGTTNVNPGETVLANLPFEVPVTYSGKYLYRVFLVDRDQRVIESEYRRFQVRERPIMPPKPPPIALGGNIVASYKNDSGPGDYVGNLSVNLVGRFKDRSFLFNTYTFHGPKDPIDVYTVLLNYYGPWVTAGLGDVSPSFSPLSVYSQGMRGGVAETKTNLGPVGWGVTVVGARTAIAEEGTATTDGVFRRMIYGAKNEVTLPGKITLHGDYVNSTDVESSVEKPGPTLKPLDDRVAGGGASWEIVPGVKLGGEFQSSAFKANKISTAAAVTDGAWRGFMGLEFSKLTLNGYMQRTGPDFVSLGAPTATKDRLTYDAGMSLSPFSWMSLYGSFNQYRDNLKDDPKVVTTHQQVLNNGVSFTLPSLTGLNFGYSINSAVGDPRSAQDNQTLTTSFGVSQGWRGQSLAANYQTSKFTDKTKKSNDLITDTVGSSLNLSLARRVSSSLGATLSKTQDQVDRSVQNTHSYSGSLNVDIIKDKLVAQTWGTLSSTNDNDAVNKADRQDTSANLEFTYLFKSKVALTLGGYRNTTRDNIRPKNDLTANGGNARLSYSF